MSGSYVDQGYLQRRSGEQIALQAVFAGQTLSGSFEPYVGEKPVVIGPLTFVGTVIDQGGSIKAAMQDPFKSNDPAAVKLGDFFATCFLDAAALDQRIGKITVPVNRAEYEAVRTAITERALRIG